MPAETDAQAGQIDRAEVLRVITDQLADIRAHARHLALREIQEPHRLALRHEREAQARTRELVAVRARDVLGRIPDHVNAAAAQRPAIIRREAVRHTHLLDVTPADDRRQVIARRRDHVDLRRRRR